MPDSGKKGGKYAVKFPPIPPKKRKGGEEKDNDAVSKLTWRARELRLRLQRREKERLRALGKITETDADIKDHEERLEAAKHEHTMINHAVQLVDIASSKTVNAMGQHWEIEHDIRYRFELVCPHFRTCLILVMTTETFSLNRMFVDTQPNTSGKWTRLLISPLTELVSKSTCWNAYKNV